MSTRTSGPWMTSDLRASTPRKLPWLRNSVTMAGARTLPGLFCGGPRCSTVPASAAPQCAVSLERVRCFLLPPC